MKKVILFTFILVSYYLISAQENKLSIGLLGSADIQNIKYLAPMGIQENSKYKSSNPQSLKACGYADGH